MASLQGRPHWIIDNVVNDMMEFRFTLHCQLLSPFDTLLPWAIVKSSGRHIRVKHMVNKSLFYMEECNNQTLSDGKHQERHKLHIK